MSSIIDVEGLSRQFTVYGKVPGARMPWRRSKKVIEAVDDLTFSIEAGSTVGYIGANGAGKSTTIKMLVGILVPTAGTVRTCGLAPMADRQDLARRVGVVFGQRSQLWWDLPLAESFDILASIHRLPPADYRARRDQLIDQLELGEFTTTPVRQLSLGQRMRAEVAAALQHSPELVILDEPTIGLDVLSKQRLREFLLAERAERGTTLLLTTHDMGDVERLCDRVLVVDHGRLHFDGTLAGLTRRVGAERALVVDLAEPTPDLTTLMDAGGTDLPGVRHLGSEADGLRQRFAFDPDHTTAAAVLGAVGRRVEVRDLSIEEPDIEQVVRRLYEAGGR